VFAFALIVQPLIGPLILERPWSQIEMFGIAPDRPSSPRWVP